MEFASTRLVLELPKLRYAFRYFGNWDFLGYEVGETVVTDRRRGKKAWYCAKLLTSAGRGGLPAERKQRDHKSKRGH